MLIFRCKTCFIFSSFLSFHVPFGGGDGCGISENIKFTFSPLFALFSTLSLSISLIERIHLNESTTIRNSENINKLHFWNIRSSLLTDLKNEQLFLSHFFPVNFNKLNVEFASETKEFIGWIIMAKNRKIKYSVFRFRKLRAK